MVLATFQRTKSHLPDLPTVETDKIISTMQVRPGYRATGRDSNWSGSVATVIAAAVALMVVGLLLMDMRLTYSHVYNPVGEVNANDKYVQNGLQNIRTGFGLIPNMALNFTNIFQHSGGVVKSALDEMPPVIQSETMIAKKLQKIAYIFAGSARSFVCPQVHWSIKSHLIDALGGEPHTFVRLSLEDNKNVKTGTGVIFKPQFDEKEVNETLKLLNPDILERFSYSDQVEEMKRFYPTEIHTVFRENDQRRYSMFYHRCRAYELMLRYERENNVRFDWVVLARIDVSWLEPILPIETYDNDRVWVTESGFALFNDQFMLIPRQYSDYLYDLNTKVQKGVYCLGGPDVETWKCNATALRSKGVPDDTIASVLPHCCADIHNKSAMGNRIGYSEHIHGRHLLMGKIPLGIGRFPVFIARRTPKGICYGDCFRIYSFQYKETIFTYESEAYPYLMPPVWPDTRGHLISSRDRNLCYALKETVFPWSPIKAVDFHRAVGDGSKGASDKISNYAVDYSKKLTDPSQRLHPSILLNPKDTEMWRIHPTWNTEGCLTFSFKTKQVGWEACRGHSMAKTNTYNPTQLFFLYVVPTKPKALEHLHPKAYHAPNWFPESTYYHPVSNFTKVMMLNSEPVNMDYRKGAKCLTAESFQLEAKITVADCTANRMEPLQTFLTVRGQADGSHPQTTNGQLRFAARPDLCLCRHDNKVVDYSLFPENDNLFVYKCEWKAHYHKNIFEFELTMS